MKIPGKLKEADLSQLVELVKGRNVLQIGCYCGRATLALAKHAWATWVLEDFKYPGGVGGIVEELKANVERDAPPDSEINLLYGTSEGWAVPLGAKSLPPNVVEVVYRDANRVGLSDEADNQLALDILRRRGGVYAWHNDNHDLKWLRVDPVPVEVN